MKGGMTMGNVSSGRGLTVMSNASRHAFSFEKFVAHLTWHVLEFVLIGFKFNIWPTKFINDTFYAEINHARIMYVLELSQSVQK